MNTRIRYSTNEGILKSVKTFVHPTNGGRFRVEINPVSLQFLITDTTADMEVVSGKASNLHSVKIAAKNALVELGVVFQAEARKDKNVN